MDRPAFASSVLSGANRIVAPSVPAACHPSRIIIGQAFAFWLIVALRISDSSADMLTRDIASCRRGRRRGKEKSDDGWWYMGAIVSTSCVVWFVLLAGGCLPPLLNLTCADDTGMVDTAAAAVRIQEHRSRIIEVEGIKNFRAMMSVDCRTWREGTLPKGV